MTAATHMPRPRAVSDRATPLELFFDLVYVFAFTQVTLFLASTAAYSSITQPPWEPEAGPAARQGTRVSHT